jgi:antitoxin component of MazEF toxin-antitoxin module
MGTHKGSAMKLKVQKLEKGLGVVLPDEPIASLGWEPGDMIDVEIDSSRLKVVRVQTDFEQAIRIAVQAMDDYRETLQALAKM